MICVLLIRVGNRWTIIAHITFTISVRIRLVSISDCLAVVNII